MESHFRKFMFSDELPGESMPWRAVTELFDNKRLIVENHRGIIAYGCDKILIKLHDGQLMVNGHDLCIVSMTKQQLIISGTIASISITKGC